MAGNLSVGGVTNTTNTVSVVKTDSSMTEIQKKKIDLIKERNKINQKAAEQYRKYEAKRLGLPEDATWEQIKLKKTENIEIKAKKEPKWA